MHAAILVDAAWARHTRGVFIDQFALTQNQCGKSRKVRLGSPQA
jgi:hypothetical protein